MRIGWVNDSMKMNGMVVMDRSTLNGCDVLQLSCYSDRVHSAVDILDSFGLPLAAGIGVVNTTFLCSNSAQWLSLVGYDVEQILCITPKVATTTPAPTSTTTVLTTTTAAPNEFMQLVITDSILASGQMRFVTATCRKCTTLLPIRVNNTMQNGNMLIEQFIASNGCKGATVRCFGSNNSQAEISFNGNYKDPTVVGRGNIFAMVMCSSRATWFFYNASVENFTSASCVLKPIASDNVTTSPANCTKCGMPTIGNVTLPGFKEGNTVIDTTTVQGCAQTIITCLNDVPTLSVRILSIENGTLASGIGSANVTLACNHASRWQTANGTLVPGFICAIEDNSGGEMPRNAMESVEQLDRMFGHLWCMWYTSTVQRLPTDIKRLRMPRKYVPVLVLTNTVRDTTEVRP
ncbi:unnamed protein product [Toxocara canis]|uniref:C6 domain-containing protein n=1 Tax=Toxocara canis TaxID=6265 RepID=A0A183UZW6_TOXCA|nr:unnamed protein product [Toxocara canis]